MVMQLQFNPMIAERMKLVLGGASEFECDLHLRDFMESACKDLGRAGELTSGQQKVLIDSLSLINMIYLDPEVPELPGLLLTMLRHSDDRRSEALTAIGKLGAKAVAAGPLIASLITNNLDTDNSLIAPMAARPSWFFEAQAGAIALHAIGASELREALLGCTETQQYRDLSKHEKLCFISGASLFGPAAQVLTLEAIEILKWNTNPDECAMGVVALGNMGCFVPQVINLFGEVLAQAAKELRGTGSIKNWNEAFNATTEALEKFFNSSTLVAGKPLDKESRPLIDVSDNLYQIAWPDRRSNTINDERTIHARAKAITLLGKLAPPLVVSTRLDRLCDCLEFENKYFWRKGFSPLELKEASLGALNAVVPHLNLEQRVDLARRLRKTSNLETIKWDGAIQAKIIKLISTLLDKNSITAGKHYSPDLIRKHLP